MEYLKKAQPQEESVTQKVRDAVSEILSAVEKETLPGVVLGQKQIPHTGRHRAFYDGIVFRAERNRGVDHGVYPSC